MPAPTDIPRKAAPALPFNDAASSISSNSMGSSTSNVGTPALMDAEELFEQARARGMTSVPIAGYGLAKVPKETFNFSENPNFRTRWGFMSWYMGVFCGIGAFWSGIGAMTMGDKRDEWGSTYTWIGVYSFLMAPCVLFFEYWRGQTRTEGPVPYRALGYAFVTIPMFLTMVTSIVALMLIGVIITNYLAWRYAETYEPAQKRKKEETVKDGWRSATAKWIHDLFYQGKAKKYFFGLLWFFINFFVLVERWKWWFDDVETKGTPMNPGWLGMAKAFGTVLDLNMSMILIPVCRTFIRFLYNISTSGHHWYSRILAWVFTWIPLDKALQWHKVMAAFIYASAWLHTWAHMQNYAVHYDTYESIWGSHIWVTGTLLLLIMHILYSSAFDSIRWGKFELFWYNHHLFIAFYFITLLHGKDYWNPNFWKYFLIPGSMYAIERAFRAWRSRQRYGIVSVTHMTTSQQGGRISAVFALEVQKQGAKFDYREGQYCFLQCPRISGFQWHPFTISSAPDQETVMFMIRNQGEGTWTSRLQEYLRAMGPAKANYYNIMHTDQDGNRVPQWKGPDGLPIIRVDGPYAAPTQHIGEYNVAVVCGAGIGVTPLRATLMSIIHHRFKYGVGKTFPMHAYFHWQVRWSDIPTFAFMCRTLKEAQEEWTDICANNPQIKNEKSFKVHVWISRYPKDPQAKYKPPVNQDNKDKHDFGVFGPAQEVFTKKKEEGNLRHRWDEWELMRAMSLNVKKGEPYVMPGGCIVLHQGRPDWENVFTDLRRTHCNEVIGVMFCGPRPVADALKVKCGEHSDLATGGTRFVLHKENF